MESLGFDTLLGAIQYLENKGMKFSHESPFSDQARAYFTFGEGKDIFADHSATITILSKGQYLVADYTDETKKENS